MALTPIQPNRAQVFLLPPSLEDWVPENHDARFIDSFVDTWDLVALGFDDEVVQWTGRRPYAPALLLKLWLYGYCCKIRSSRQLEQACTNHVGMMWLAGLLRPDHNTLANFLKAHRQAFITVFQRLLKTLAQMELVGMVLHALDGTKIPALQSKRGAWHRENLLKALEGIEAVLTELVAQTEATDADEADLAVALPPALTEATARREAIRDALAALDAAGTDHLQSREPEARMMKGGDGRTTFAYNAQAQVDARSGLIVAQDVVMDAADNAQLVPMLEQVAETLGAVADETLADGGYQSGEAFAQLEEQGRSVLVNLEAVAAAQTAPFAKEQFTWEPEADRYLCPQGSPLAFLRKKAKKHKRDGSPYQVWVYQCRACAGCPCRDQCTTSRTGRSVERTAFDDAFTRQRARQRTAEARELLRLRGSLIERVFGRIKQIDGFRRWTVDGLAAVRAQWALLCVVYNLRIVRNWWRQGTFSFEAFQAAWAVVCQKEQDTVA